MKNTRTRPILKSRNSKSKVKLKNSFLESLQQARSIRLSLTQDATIAMENSNNLNPECSVNQTNSESDAVKLSQSR